MVDTSSSVLLDAMEYATSHQLSIWDDIMLAAAAPGRVPHAGFRRHAGRVHLAWHHGTEPIRKHSGALISWPSDGSRLAGLTAIPRFDAGGGHPALCDSLELKAKPGVHR